MAKTRQPGSAAQRRAQERQQRSRREEARTSALQKGKGQHRGPMVRKKDRSGLFMVIGVLTLIAAIIVVFIVISRAPASQPQGNPHQADPAIVRQLTGVSQSTWEAVGNGGLPRPFTAMSGQPPLIGPGGHPEFLYVGGVYCPNCAAERWAMVNALSRFGVFKNLSQVQSYEYNVSTFSFAGSSYTSQYLDFVPKEILGNALDSSGQNYVSLEKLTAAEQQVFHTYDKGQTFPFLDIHNTYLATAATYAFSVLLDSSQQPLSWQAIANALTDPASPITKGVLGTANYLTAAICTVTNQQPGKVCTVPAIQQIEHTLSATTQTIGASPLTLAPARLRSPSSLIWRE